MAQRRSFFQANQRIFLWVFIIGVIIALCFLVRFFFLAYQYGPIKNIIHPYPILSLLLWFWTLFFLFSHWKDTEFYGFLDRLSRELQEVMEKERNHIFFRKNAPWPSHYFEDYITSSLQKNQDEERKYLAKLNDIRQAIKTNEVEKLKALAEDL